jgi:ribonuclease HI
MTKTNNEKSYTTSFNRNSDTRTYLSTLQEGPGGSLRSELWAIIIATAAISENTFLMIYTDLKSATATSKKHQFGHKTPQQMLRSACPVELSILRNLTHRQYKHITLKWIQFHNRQPLNELADRKSNDASTAMQLGIADYNRTNPLILKQIEIKFLYQHSKIVNKDFGELLRNLVQLKILVTIERIIADPHSCNRELKSTTHALPPTTFFKNIPGLRFRLRLAAGLLPTPELSNRTNNLVRIQYCHLGHWNLNIDNDTSSTAANRQTN